MTPERIDELAESNYHDTIIAHCVGAGLDISEPLEESVCPCCNQQAFDVRKRRRNTAYLDELLNWIICCGECFERDNEYYAERWAEYYGSR